MKESNGHDVQRDRPQPDEKKCKEQFLRRLIIFELIQYKYGVTDGARTRDHRNHNPGLYQLSYNHHSRNFLSKAKAISNGWRK